MAHETGADNKEKHVMKIEAVVVDVDGTITDEKRRLNLRAVELIRRIEEKGIKVILATGNIACVAETLSIFIGTSGGLIIENGGIIELSDKKTKIVLADDKEVRRAFEYLLKNYNVKPVPRIELRKTDLAILRDNIDVETVRKALKNFKVKVVDSGFAIHIMSEHVNKGYALKKLAEYEKLNLKNVVAIGDNENDREMLKGAGYSIAVANRSLDADYVTKRRLGEGGAEALMHVLKMINDRIEVMEK